MKTIRLLLFFSVLIFITKDLYGAGINYLDEYVSVATYGADGTDTNDDSTAFANAINYCKDNGYKTLFIPVGTYYINSSLPQLNSSFSFVSVVGENASSTVVNCSNLGSEEPVLWSSGGSGKLIGGTISGLTISGSGIQSGIMLRGTCGITIKDCKFSALKYGIVFSNDSAAGTFTEFSMAENCHFKLNTALYYVRGAGDESFHGSGMRHCTVDCQSGSTDPVIKVGNDTSKRIVLYNAPLDFQVWTRESMNLIESNTTSNSKIITHGTIKLELFNSSEPTLAGGTTAVYHAGNITGWGSSIKFGDLQLVDWAFTNPDGSINIQRKPFCAKATLTAASTTIDDIKSSKLGSMVSVHLKTSFYEYNYLLFICHNGYGNAGHISVIANPRSYNQAGYGAPTFSVNSNGQLVVTNSNYAGREIALQAHVFGNGQREYYFLAQ